MNNGYDDNLQNNDNLQNGNNLNSNDNSNENNNYSNSLNQVNSQFSNDTGNYNNYSDQITEGNHNNYNNYYANDNQNTNYGYSYNNNPYTVYPTPQVNENKEKPKKKRGNHGFAKLTAAAIIFGLISGTVFQGINFVSNKMNLVGQGSSNNFEIAGNTIGDVDTNDSIAVPVGTKENGVVTDVSNVVQNVMPSIVAINSTMKVNGRDFFGRPINETQEGSGSGIIIAQNGSQILIVTNNHVVANADQVEIVFVDDSKAQATIKGTDATADLAVVSVNLSDLSEETIAAIKVATLGNSDDLKAGEMAIAIGNALGYGQSVTVGYISALNREITIEDKTMTLLQTDAAINPGNSGGALLNTKGEVIGINSVKYASSDVEGMGYAIPITSAVPMINELMNREVIAESDQGFLGIVKDTAQNVTDVYATRFNMPIGVYINDVVEGSPAEAAGLKQSDIITGLKNKKIETIDDLVEALSYTRSGETITLKVHSRDNSGVYVEKELSVTLASKR